MPELAHQRFLHADEATVSVEDDFNLLTACMKSLLPMAENRIDARTHAALGE